MDDQSAEAALKLWVVMNRARNSILNALEKQVEAHGLTFTEFAALEVLLHKGMLPIGEVGQRVLLSSGSMTYVIDKLERRDLIQRKACPEDRRIIYADLTESGRSLIEEVFAEHAELIRKLMSGIPDHYIEQTAIALRRLGLYADEHALALLEELET